MHHSATAPVGTPAALGAFPRLWEVLRTPQERVILFQHIKDKLKEKGSSIKKLDLEPEGYDGEIERLRKEGINFKLYNYQ